MASWLEQQIAALQAQGIDVSPEALAAQIPQGYDQMPQHPAASPQPAAPQPSIWGGAMTGAARDGLVGGLVGTFANPNAQAPQGEANAYQAVTGILRNVGRAIGSAYGNPNYAQGARAIDQRGMAIEQQGQQNQIENQMGLERLRQGQVDLGFKYAGEQRAAEKDARFNAAQDAVIKAMRGRSTDDPRALLDASAAAFANGETDLGIKLRELAQKAGKAPEAPTVKDFYTPDGKTEQREWNGSEWVTLGTGPRFQEPKDTSGTTEKNLRNEFIDQSKQFQTVSDMFNTIRVASDGSNNGVSDMSLVFGFMKIIDPTSTVREGEYASAKNSGSVPDYIQNTYNQVKSGAFLTPDQRKHFVSESEKLYKVRLARHQKLEETYRGLSERNKVNPENVVLDFKNAPAAGGGAEAKDTPTKNTVGGKPVMRRPDGSMYVVE